MRCTKPSRACGIKARGHRELITVVGHAAVIAAGEWVTASGEWVNDHTHGQQFKTRFMRTSAPTSVDGIEKYLGSGMIRGIGPVYANKMVKVFGEKVFKTVITKSVRLEESPAYRESIFTFAPDSTGAAEYYSLCEEVIDRA